MSRPPGERARWIRSSATERPGSQASVNFASWSSCSTRCRRRSIRSARAGLPDVVSRQRQGWLEWVDADYLDGRPAARGFDGQPADAGADVEKCSRLAQSRHQLGPLGRSCFEASDNEARKLPLRLENDSRHRSILARTPDVPADPAPGESWPQ
jgi:hypothetical protein